MLPVARRLALPGSRLIILGTWNMTAEVEAEPIETDWLDDMVKKLKDELEAQINRAAKAVVAKRSSPTARASDARTLAALERTLEKLAQMEQSRALVRETKIKKQGSRDALERRLDKLAAAAETKSGS